MFVGLRKGTARRNAGMKESCMNNSMSCHGPGVRPIVCSNSARALLAAAMRCIAAATKNDGLLSSLSSTSTAFIRFLPTRGYVVNNCVSDETRLAYRRSWQEGRAHDRGYRGPPNPSRNREAPKVFSPDGPKCRAKSRRSAT